MASSCGWWPGTCSALFRYCIPQARQGQCTDRGTEYLSLPTVGGCGFDSSSFLNLHSHFLLTFAISRSFDGSPNKPQRCSTPADSPATTSRDTAATCWRALRPPTPGTIAMVIKEFLDSDRVNFLIWRFVKARCFCQPCALLAACHPPGHPPPPNPLSPSL